MIIDMVSDFAFEDGAALAVAARDIVGPIRSLRDAADAAGMPTVYVNDNFGEWHSEKSRLVRDARAAAGKIVAPIAPRACDYFVLKPQLSAFYATNLPVLLPKLGVGRLVLTGVAADMCVLFSAADAYMRDYALWVPEDAVAGPQASCTAAALSIIGARLGAETAATSSLALVDWLAAAEAHQADP